MLRCWPLFDSRRGNRKRMHIRSGDGWLGIVLLLLVLLLLVRGILDGLQPILVLFAGLWIGLGIGRYQSSGMLSLFSGISLLVRNAMMPFQQIPSRECSPAGAGKRLFFGIWTTPIISIFHTTKQAIITVHKEGIYYAFERGAPNVQCAESSDRSARRHELLPQRWSDEPLERREKTETASRHWRK